MAADQRGWHALKPKLDRQSEEAMAKGQPRGNREAKKPKADKPKGSVSAYKQSLSKGGQSLIPPTKKT